jgi:hypothetical protein
VTLGGDEMDSLLECLVPAVRVSLLPRVYVVGHAGLSVCQVMSIPAFMAVVLAMFI